MSEQNQSQKQPESPVALLLNDASFKRQIALALPRHMTPDRMARIALTEVRKNPKLLQADKLSFAGAIMACAQLGLEPGNGLGHAYLIPFWNTKLKCFEVQMIPGYKGLIDLARRSGQIDSISARIVREKDFFEYEYGDDERIRHKPYEGPEEEAGRIIYVYAIARLKGGGVQREVMSRAQIDRIKDRKKSENPVWDTDFDEMARKTAVRRIVKYLPMSPELARAIDLDNKNFDGESQDGHRALRESHAAMSFIDVDYTPAPTVSLGATTIAENNREDETRVANGQRQGLELKFIDEGDRLVSEGMSEQTVAFHLNLTKWPELETLSTEKLIVMTEKLKTLTGKK